MSALLTGKLLSLILFGIPAIIWLAYLFIRARKNTTVPPPDNTPRNTMNLKFELPQVSYTQEGSGGYFYYKSKDGNLSGWWDFTGGETLASLTVPSEAEWASKTQIPIIQRNAVLHYIGRETVRQQTTIGHGRYEIGPNYILIYP